MAKVNSRATCGFKNHSKIHLVLTISSEPINVKDNQSDRVATHKNHAKKSSYTKIKSVQKRKKKEKKKMTDTSNKIYITP